MDITWHGHSCFTIKTKRGTVVFDPYDPEQAGLKLPPLKADILLVSHNHEGHNNVKAVEGSPQIIDWPGEYEVKGIAVTASKVAYSETEKGKHGYGLIFTVEADGLRLCYLGDMGEVPDTALVESIGDIDILFLPIGGRTVMDPKQAHLVIEELEPRAVIPMHYKVAGSKSGESEIEPFLKMVGASAPEAGEKFSITGRSELKEDKMECILLTPQTA
jgi:L-ascorbate metabolism protein UlaG (beta-lactamase superfamily)